jgi:CRISPR-associated protein Csb1
MFDSLNKAPRLLIEAELKPLQGDRFQPTGFADLGAAEYERPDGKRMLLVETAQSMANRMEAACLAEDNVNVAAELKGLPYVVVKLSGASDAETSSLAEAHRLNSPFIFKALGFEETFSKGSGYAKGKTIDWKKVAETFFRLDPNSLLHGVFMANFEDGRIRLPRAITAFIEAEDVREVASGGVKNNPIDPSGKLRATEYDKNVYGNVPYHRTEYVAGKMQCYFNLDLALITGFGLPADARNLLVALALYKIRRFLDGGLRLRTACDLRVVGEPRVTAPAGFTLPLEELLLGQIKIAIDACAQKKLFADPPVTRLTVETKMSKKEEATESPDADEAEKV